MAAKALHINGGAENDHVAYTAIDWLEVSPEGDIMSNDSRAAGDGRQHAITAEDYAAAMGAPGLVAALNPLTVNMWNNRIFDRAKGGAFMDPNMVPEPVSMALLALGGLALIRRRK